MVCCFNTRVCKISLPVISGLNILLAVLIGMPNVLADDNWQHDATAWQTVDLVIPVNERWAITNQWQHRLNDNWTQHDTSQIWLGIERKLTDKLIFRVGGAVMPTYRPPDNWEARIWQQFGYKQPLPKEGELELRFRNEQQFVEGAHAPANRIRTLAGVNYPIPKLKKWRVHLTEELFIDAYGVVGGTQPGVTENRVQITVERQLSETASLEIGYLNIMDFNTPGQDVMEHALVTQLNLRPTFLMKR